MTTKKPTKIKARKTVTRTKAGTKSAPIARTTSPLSRTVTPLVRTEAPLVRTGD